MCILQSSKGLFKLWGRMWDKLCWFSDRKLCLVWENYIELWRFSSKRCKILLNSGTKKEHIQRNVRPSSLHLTVSVHQSLYLWLSRSYVPLMPPSPAKTMDHTDRDIYRPGFPRESLTPLGIHEFRGKAPCLLTTAWVCTFSHKWNVRRTNVKSMRKTKERKTKIWYQTRFRDDQLT